MLLSINQNDTKPIYLQIVQQIKDQINKGILKPDDELPSVRELSGALGINLHTVHKAYRLLTDQGIIHLRLGQRARIAELKTEMADNSEELDALEAELKNLITESSFLGMSKKDFREMVERLLKLEE